MRVLFATPWVPPDRAPAFEALCRRLPDLEVVTFGGRVHHATAGDEVPAVAPRDLHRLARRFDVVVAGTAGRTALPAAWTGARRARVPFVLWSALWGHLTTPAHLAAQPLLRAVHRDAAVVVGYGEHVTAYAKRLGARRTAVAPQAVDAAFWSEGARPERRGFEVLAVARDAPGKGLDVLRAAWPEATVVTGGASPVQLRNLYASASVLVVPSVRTRAFLEPWGLVANEAMHQATPVIATTAVGAAAGGLVRHERNGLVVPDRDPRALRLAIERLRDDPALRERLGAAAGRDVAPFTHEAWATAFAAALTDSLDHPRSR